MTKTFSSLLLTTFALAAFASAQAQSGYEPYSFTTLAGLPPGKADATGAAARFQSPQSVAVDNGGNMYVADTDNHSIRKVTPAGVVTTFAGMSGEHGYVEGPVATARFYRPSALAFANGGNLYVADSGNGAIRKITPGLLVTTFVVDTGSLSSVHGITVDSTGNIYVSDGYAVRKITPAGVITTLAGDYVPGYHNGQGTQALFDYPTGIAVNAAGLILVADTNNDVIRYVTQSGDTGDYSYIPYSGSQNEDTVSYNRPRGLAVDSAQNVYVSDYETVRKIDHSTLHVSSLAGSAFALYGNADGTGHAARFYKPGGLALDAAGNVYVADTGNALVRKMNPSLQVTTVAGRGGPGASDGGNGSARFAAPFGVAVDNAGNAYVADTTNQTIRKISPTGVVSTLAGLAGVDGNADGQGSAARFEFPRGVAVDGSGNVYVADTFNSSVRKITPAGAVSTVASLFYFVNMNLEYALPDGIAAQSDGTLYVAATDASAIYKITPAGDVSYFAGVPGVRGSQDGDLTTALFNRPSGIALDGAGNIYVADTYNSRIRKISTAGIVSTLTTTQFFRPRGVAADGFGSVYFTMWYDSTVRRIAPDGTVTILGGSPFEPQSADGRGSAARFSGLNHIAVNYQGLLYIADTNNNTIRIGQAYTAVSRKTHGSTSYDIDLPLVGTPGIECRSGGGSGAYQVVITCARAATFNNASVTGGSGQVSSTSGNGSASLVLNLTGLTSGHTIAVTVAGLNDGSSTRDLVIPMSVLVGDTNGNGTVNASDVSQTKAQVGQAVGPANFREDINANGSISASDVSTVKSSVGTSIPTP